jgi:hypothetical protein
MGTTIKFRRTNEEEISFFDIVHYQPTARAIYGTKIEPPQKEGHYVVWQQSSRNGVKKVHENAKLFYLCSK